MNDNSWSIEHPRNELSQVARVWFVLFGFVKDLALHFGRSPLIHSGGCESAGDRPNCLASSPTKSESFTQHTG